ncbi:class I SAM-dependent methyltransferase [Micromonospora sp. NPDC000207]|uniref:class I SAM-dependent methyltransferase n=1 Tax=Micromonospora sp. NPDC000207 TaxID=3154246 RepID=UPI003329D622
MFNWVPGGNVDHTAYDTHAEHFDLLVAGMWRALGPTLAAELRGLDPHHGPAVDMGAGTGRGTELVARLNPDVEVLAVEPSPALRTAMFTRIGGDPDLARRVTVLPGTATGTPLPDRVCAVLLANAVAELNPVQRRELWRSVAGRLAPGAPLVVNVGVPGVQEENRVRIGAREYHNTGVVVPGEPGRVRWRITTEVRAAGAVVQRLTADHVSWEVSLPQLCQELTEAGLRPRRTGVVVVATR